MASNNEITTIKPLTIIGLISGTSMDGIDTVIEQISMENNKPNFITLNAETYPYKDKKLIQALRNIEPGKNLTGTEYDEKIANEFSNAALQITKKADLSPKNIDYIASHGQTVWYIPKSKNQKKTKASIIGNGNIIAKTTKIKTIFDFRTADINAGGLGAPLSPILHFYRFPPESIILNIGGIANLTAIDSKPDINNLIAFDTGPGNFLIDELVRFYSKEKETCDANGSWSSKGTPNKEIVNELLKHEYFSEPYPKATDRKLFNPELLQKLLKFSEKNKLSPFDTIATAALLTAKSVALAVRQCEPPRHPEFPRHPERSEGSRTTPVIASSTVIASPFVIASPPVIASEAKQSLKRLIVVGGGRLNPTLMNQLAAELPALDVMPSEQLNINGDFLEAELMAFLGFLTANGFPGNIPHITGTQYPVVLGKVVEP